MKMRAMATVGPGIALGALLPLMAALGAACSSQNHLGTQGTAGAGAGAGQAGSTGTGAGGGGPAGNGGTGGTSGAGGTSAGGAGGEGATGAGGAAGAGGATAVGPQPRVLLVDPATNRFLTYDLDGQPVRDLSPQLDFGAGFGKRIVRVDGLGTAWDENEWSVISATGAPRGVDEPLTPSVILIHATATGGDVVKVKALEPSGALVTSQTLSGAWNGFDMSPKRGYLYAHVFSDNDTQANGVIRVSDGQIVWQGRSGWFGFARDERHFVYFPPGTSRLPTVVDLATGAEVASTSTLIPPDITTFGLLAVLDGRAVISAGWQNHGTLLWTVDWQGQVTPFRSDIPMHVSESLQRFHPTGTKAVWSRGMDGTGSPPSAELGAYEIDLATNASMPWSGPDYSCFGRPGEIAFKLAGNMVQSCACGDGTCRDIAAVPAVSDARWTPRLYVSANRRTVVVGFEWISAQAPVNPPEVLCLRASGEVITRLPWGMVKLDDTGQLLLISSAFPATTPQTGIVNLVAGTVTWLAQSPRALIVYE
jgi:hypothetical protein